MQAAASPALGSSLLPQRQLRHGGFPAILQYRSAIFRQRACPAASAGSGTGTGRGAGTGAAGRAHPEKSAFSYFPMTAAACPLFPADPQPWELPMWTFLALWQVSFPTLRTLILFFFFFGLKWNQIRHPPSLLCSDPCPKTQFPR